jgi:hypothetical protein
MQLEQSVRAAAKHRFSRHERGEAAQLDEQDFRPAVERLQPWSKLALAHGAYLMFIGGWPLLHLRSFAKVTGPKPEGWLAKAVGACLANVGIALVQSALRGGRVRREMRSLAVRMAMTFAAFDFYYGGLRRRISPVYLANGGAQLLFAILWEVDRVRESREMGRPPPAAHA